MGTMHGSFGSFQWSGSAVTEMQNWELNISGDNLDDTAFGDAWRSYASGLKSWKGSAKGNFDKDDTNGHAALKDAALGGTTATAKFFLDSQSHLYGTVRVNANLSAPVDGLITVNYDLQGSGALAYSATIT